MTAITVGGWLCSAALAVLLAQGRRHMLAHSRHLARVAHEVRGPLHAAGMVLHSVRRQTPDDTRAGDALAALQVELDRLALAADDLQAGPGSGVPVSRHRTTAPAGASCDVAALVRVLAPAWEAQAAAAGRVVQITVPAAPIHAAARRLRLAQALGNLVVNALEHGAGEIGVLVRRGPGDTVAVEVTDCGHGLPAAVSSLIARPADPTGLHGHGLAITATIANDAGGRLAAAPAARGARLVLSLPAAPDARLLAS